MFHLINGGWINIYLNMIYKKELKELIDSDDSINWELAVEICKGLNDDTLVLYLIQLLTDKDTELHVAKYMEIYNNARFLPGGGWSLGPSIIVKLINDLTTYRDE